MAFIWEFRFAPDGFQPGETWGDHASHSAAAAQSTAKAAAWLRTALLSESEGQSMRREPSDSLFSKGLPNVDGLQC